MEFNFCLYQKLIDSFFFYGTDWCLDLMIKNYYQEQILYVELILKKKKKKQQQQQQISSILFSFLKKNKKYKNPLSF